MLDEVLEEEVLGEEEVPVGIDAGALLARLGEGQAALARDLAANALGKTVEQLVEDDTQLVADISLQLTRLQQEDTREAARVELGRLLNQG